VLASCPPGCTCVACEMGLFDWLVPEGKTDPRPGNLSAHRDSSFAALAAAGSDGSEAGLASPGPKRQQLAWEGWAEGPARGAGSVSGDILPGRTPGAPGSEQPGAYSAPGASFWSSTGGEAREREGEGEGERERERRGVTGGGVTGGGGGAARAGAGGHDEPVGGGDKGDQAQADGGGEVLDMVVSSDKRQQSGALFRRSRVEELEVSPLAQAFLDSTLPKAARAGVPGVRGGAGAGAGEVFGEVLGGGVGIPGGAHSMPAVRPRRSRARPAADGTMRPRAAPTIQVRALSGNPTRPSLQAWTCLLCCL